jgi:hypothetical protein
LKPISCSEGLFAGGRPGIGKGVGFEKQKTQILNLVIA